MAKINIDVSVTNSQRLDEVDKKLKKLEKSTDSLGKKVNDSGKIFGMSKLSVAGWATAITGALAAVNKFVSAGAEFLKNQEDMNAAIAHTSDLAGGVDESFGALSATIVKNTGAWEAYRDTLDSVSSALDGLSVMLGGKIAAAYRIENEISQQRILNKQKEIEINKRIVDSINKEQKARDTAFEKEIQQDIERQKWMTKIEEKIAKEQKAIEEKQRAEEEAIYVTELANIGYDAMGESLDNVTSSTKKMREATEAAAEASKEAAQASIASANAYRVQAIEANNANVAQGGTSATYSVGGGTAAYGTGYSYSESERKARGMSDYEYEMLKESKKQTNIQQDTYYAVKG